MKSLHCITLSVFCKEHCGENKDLINQKLSDLSYLDLPSEKLSIDTEIADGLEEGSKINIFKLKLEKSKHARAFLNNFLSRLDDSQINTLIDQIDSRLDENCHFFIRIDKDKWYGDKIELTDSGNCFHINISIAAYPAKKEGITSL